jgi:DNA (cytosine-5)-methyltransferase 1
VSYTIGSLFSGIGGLELGLERAGLGPVVWQVECDPFCRRVLARHWPDADRFDDVREVGAHNLLPVDIICGGFPCQDISVAGRGAGLEGEHSGLWREYARIVRELRPRFFVVENVAALLARGLGDVLGDLAACGYDAQWDCLPASAVGAPHQRDRIFVVANVANPECQRRSQGMTEQNLHQWNSYAMEPCMWPPCPDDLHAWRQVPSELKPSVCRVAHGIPHRVDRLRALGNAVVPQVAEICGLRLLDIADG